MAPERTERLLAVFEVSYGPPSEPSWVRCTTSTPGRDGTVQKVWSLDNGQMTEGTCEDVCAYVGRVVTSAIVEGPGLQLRLGVTP